MDQPGLFDAPYPSQPGWKRTRTSRAAAEAMKPRALTLRDRIVDLLKFGGEFTPDEAADVLGVTPFAARPRFTELKLMGLVMETGELRRNTSGHRAQVYRRTPHADPPR